MNKYVHYRIHRTAWHLAFAAVFVAKLTSCAAQHTGRQVVRSFTEPSYKSVAASSVPGIITESNVHEGDHVSVGDPLASINRKVLQATLNIAVARAGSTARLEAATSQWELTKSQLAAIEALVDGGHTNRFEVDQMRSEYQKAYAEYQAADDDQKLAQLEVKRIQAELDARTIRSPIDGYVTEIHKKLGENISSNEPQYATVVHIDQLRVRFYLDAETLSRCTRGDHVSVLIGNQKAEQVGVVTFASPVIDSDSGLGRLHVLIDNRDLKFQSGIVAFWNGRTDGHSSVDSIHHANSYPSTTTRSVQYSALPRPPSSDRSNPPSVLRTTVPHSPNNSAPSRIPVQSSATTQNQTKPVSIQRLSGPVPRASRALSQDNRQDSVTSAATRKRNSKQTTVAAPQQIPSVSHVQALEVATASRSRLNAKDARSGRLLFFSGEQQRRQSRRFTESLRRTNGQGGDSDAE